MQPLRLLAAAAIVCSATISRADGTTHVAVVDTSRLYEPGGITRWLSARARLADDRKNLVVVESPDGKTVEDDRISECRAPSSEELKRVCRRIDDARRTQQEDAAWSRHEQEVLDPIEADVRAALERYARTHGIDLLLDRHKLGDLFLVVAGSADITTAFIKDYNATSRPRSGAR